jgi:anti-sigma regulatory factor (Ser/Thr protein kinase)
VRDKLHGFLGPRRLAEAELLTSELVTNAVRHAQLKVADPIGLDIDVDSDTVHVAVVDAGAGFDFTKIFDEPRDLRGRSPDLSERRMASRRDRRRLR